MTGLLSVLRLTVPLALAVGAMGEASAAPTQAAEVTIRPHKKAGSAVVRLKGVVSLEHGGSTTRRDLSITLPEGVARELARRVPDGLRVSATEPWGGLRCYAQLRVTAGKGDETLVVDRYNGKIRVQFGVGKSARSYWIGQTPNGFNLGQGTFIGSGGKAKQGATIIDPVTLSPDKTLEMNGRTKRWYATPSKLKDEAPERALNGSTMAQLASLTSSKLEPGQRSRTKQLAEIKRVRDPRPHPVKRRPKRRTRSSTTSAREKKSTFSYQPVEPGSRPLYGQVTSVSCAIASTRMAIATVMGKNIPERELRDSSRGMAGGYHDKSSTDKGGTHLYSVPKLLEQTSTPGTYHEVEPTATLRMVKRWTAGRQPAIISYETGKDSNHAVVVDEVKHNEKKVLLVVRNPSPVWNGKREEVDVSTLVKKMNKRCVLVGDEAVVAQRIQKAREARKEARARRKASGKVRRERARQEALQRTAAKAERRAAWERSHPRSSRGWWNKGIKRLITKIVGRPTR